MIIIFVLGDYIMKKIMSLISLILILVQSLSFFVPTFSQANTVHYTDPPTFSFLSEDTIIYFQAPEQSEIIIFYEHIWGYGNATFTIYDETGQYYDQCDFTYQETRTQKTIDILKTGTYKLVATGVNFRYQIDFIGPPYDYKCVALALPHKAVIRVRDNEITSIYIPISSKHIDIHMSTMYNIPARDATIRIYDEHNILEETVYLDSTDIVETYEQIVSFSREQNNLVFWRIEIEGHGGGQSKVVVWTNQSVVQYPTQQCTLLTPDPVYYFIPLFLPRSTSITYEQTNHTACIGSSGFVVGEEEYVDLYNAYVDDLNLKTSKHWVSWRWREQQGSIAKNDDEDPFHINWDGFNMDAFDERMQYYVLHHIQPIICLQWDTTAFITKHPAQWSQNEIEEFAEFCLAIAIHCVAPDLKGSSVEQEPYDILGIMPLNEPNLLYTEHLDMSESADAYISLLRTVGQRFKNHPDQRINKIKFIVPGISPNLYSSQELDHWITQLLIHAEEYVDIITWDQYGYYLLEELDAYEMDILRIQAIMDALGIQKPIGLSEFGIHGGIPTIQEFYGSTFAKLYAFGALAQSISNDMSYPIYFTLIDPNDEPRQKGLLSGITSYPPFSYLPPFSKKPQYYAMQTIGWICNGTVLDVIYNTSQLDILGSTQEETIRFGISNRYETSTTLSIPIAKDTPITLYNVTDSGLSRIEEFVSTGNISISIPPWNLYYIEANTQSTSPKSDLFCEGSLTWHDIRPGSIINGSFTIENRGDADTILQWEILEYPTWGIWDFAPSINGQLSSEQGKISINVTISVPTEKNRHYNEYLKIINKDNPTDFEIIPVVLSTPLSQRDRLLEFLNNGRIGIIEMILNYLRV